MRTARSEIFSRKVHVALRSALRSPGVSMESSARGLSQTSLALIGLLVIALVVRMIFIGTAGFPNDVSAFEAWALTLADHPTYEFYAKTQFADYPPGYFYVLFAVGHLYRYFVHSDPTYEALKVFVKLPGILCDIVDTALIFGIVRRYASTAWSFAAAAFFAFNPAIIYISAYWGQVDSVPGALTLGALYMLLGAAARAPGRPRDFAIVAAWLLLAASVLMKPPAIVLAPVFIAWAFMTDDGVERQRRGAWTMAGISAGIVLAYLSTIPFHLGLNPVSQFAWLYERYAFAAGVYAYNSVNAFNLYVMAPNNHFWMADSTALPDWRIFGFTFGLPMYEWGIGLLLAAVVLIVSRLVQRREPIALLEAAMVLSLGYFVLSTRMHERYIYNAVMLAVPLVFYRRRYLYASVIISLTLLANLMYSFYYVGVMSTPGASAGLDTTDLAPLVSRMGAFLNVAAFFYLGYVFLGTGADVLDTLGRARSVAGDAVAKVYHRWFSPLEGTAWMLPRDWAIAAFLTVTSFVVSFVDYTWPAEKIFDEIYYARAGEEYLTHKEIFEFTHPPLTKLWITLSMMLFGGMHGLGDTAAGWRFLNLVMGALMVLVVYVFAKRVLRSTPFATIAASLLLLDGFHYVQSRIATPEITVAFFSILTLYAFYRFWIASQVRVAPYVDPASATPLFAFVVGALVLAGVASYVVANGQGFTAFIVAFIYFGSGAYVAARYLVPRFVTKPPPLVSYADGSRVLAGTLTTPDGGTIGPSGVVTAGESTRAVASALVAEDEGLRIEYARDGNVRYATDDGEARFSPDGLMVAGEATIDGRRDGTLWLWILALCAGCLGASKWNGLFDFFVVWVLTAAVVAQRYVAPLRRSFAQSVAARAATFGNPSGFSLDLVVTTMLFVGGTIYVLCYIPYFRLGHSFGDLVGLQSQMFGYHYDLKATHPYGSKWWQWPFILRPISYYYHDWRAAANLNNPLACCVAEIIAIPNPAVWWGGLVSVPFIGWLAFRERNKAYLLLVTAYLFQWLPWASSPRVAFEYHFFPNLAIICIANAVFLQRTWLYGVAIARGTANRWTWPKLAVGGYLALVVSLFVFFYPVWAGLHVPWDVWDARMWHWLMKNQWV